MYVHTYTCMYIHIKWFFFFICKWQKLNTLVLINNYEQPSSWATEKAFLPTWLFNLCITWGSRLCSEPTRAPPFPEWVPVAQLAGWDGHHKVPFPPHRVGDTSSWMRGTPGGREGGTWMFLTEWVHSKEYCTATPQRRHLERRLAGPSPVFSQCTAAGSAGWALAAPVPEPAVICWIWWSGWNGWTVRTWCSGSGKTPSWEGFGRWNGAGSSWRKRLPCWPPMGASGPEGLSSCRWGPPWVDDRWNPWPGWTHWARAEIQKRWLEWNILA